MTAPFLLYMHYIPCAYLCFLHFNPRHSSLTRPGPCRVDFSFFFFFFLKEQKRFFSFYTIPVPTGICKCEFGVPRWSGGTVILYTQVFFLACAFTIITSYIHYLALSIIYIGRPQLGSRNMSGRTIPLLRLCGGGGGEGGGLVVITQYNMPQSRRGASIVYTYKLCSEQ